jgi:hypothetical protein
MPTADSVSWHVHNMLRSLPDISSVRLLLTVGGFLSTVILCARTALTVCHENQNFFGHLDVGQKWAERFELSFLNHN